MSAGTTGRVGAEMTAPAALTAGHRAETATDGALAASGRSEVRVGGRTTGERPVGRVAGIGILAASGRTGVHVVT